MMSKIRIDAILIALAIFGLLVLGLNEIKANISPQTGDRFLILSLNVAVFVIYVGAGFISARLAGSWGVVHGVAVGVFATLIAVAFYSAQTHRLYPDFVEHWMRWFLFSMLTCGFGGALWDAGSSLRKLFVRTKGSQ